MQVYWGRFVIPRKQHHKTASRMVELIYDSGIVGPSFTGIIYLHSQQPEAPKPLHVAALL